MSNYEVEREREEDVVHYLSFDVLVQWRIHQLFVEGDEFFTEVDDHDCPIALLCNLFSLCFLFLLWLKLVRAVINAHS